tara:strand:+ start:466 stop:990 length:525 start_codon:yes stop_codon:yes gene_type:complete
MTSKLKVNIIADGGDNAIMTSNGSGTLTLNNAALKNTPAFHVTRSGNQSIANDTLTKIQWNNEILDSDNAFDSSTNYRFTPQVSGQYYFCMHTRLNTDTDTENNYQAIRKNGSDIVQSYFKQVYYNGVECSTIVSLNGSSDYIEFFIYQASGGSNDLDSNNQNTYAYGYRLIGA